MPVLAGLGHTWHGVVEADWVVVSMEGLSCISHAAPMQLGVARGSLEAG